MAAVTDASMAKARIKEQILAGKPKYNVANFYSDTGPFQLIARSQALEITMCVVVCFYAVWAAVDVDNNKETNLLDCDPVFMVVNIAFTAIFCLEVLIRFMAFRRKSDALRDSWILADAVLAPLVILDAWVPILRFFQIIARMPRIWRKVPEMLIIIKGFLTATRSVFFCLLLETFLTYIFAFALCTLLRDTPIGEAHFNTVIESMHAILVHAIFVGAHADVLVELNAESPIAEVFLVIFIFLSYTTLAITFGVMCEVISVVSAVEKEVLVTEWVSNKCSSLFAELDEETVSKESCQKMLMSPECARAIQEVGVDVVGLVDSLDFLFSDDEQSMTMSDFMEVLLSLRGSSQATVKDIVDLRKFMLQTTEDNTESVNKAVTKPLSDRLAKVEELLQQLLDKKESNAPDDAVEDV